MPLAVMLAIIVLGAQQASAQSTLIVPDQYPTIQAAVNAAVNGDSVLVAPGTYAGNIVINKSITLLSQGGASVTHISPAAFSGGLAVDFQAGSAQAVIDGFKISSLTLGIRSTTAITVRNCTFTCINTGLGFGAIEQNTYPFSQTSFSTTTVQDCKFDGCLGEKGIVGENVSPSSPNISLTITRCVATNCFTAPNSNGDYNPVLSASVSTNGTVSQSRVIGSLGLGISANNVSRCLSYDNFDGIYAFYVSDSAAVGNFRRGIQAGFIQGCTATANGHGSPLTGFGMNYSASQILNSISAGNVGFDLGSPQSWTPGTTTFVSHSLIGVTPGPNTGTSVLTGDPLFVDAANGDYRLSPNSPCRDTGFGSSGTADLDGLPRISGAAKDMGAYEVPDSIFPGTNEALALYFWRNGGDHPQTSVVSFEPGDIATFLFISPGGSLTGTYPMIAAQFFPDWLPPTAPIIPGVWLDAGAFVAYGGFPNSPFFLGLPAAGVNGAWSVPPGLQGLRLRLQGFASTTFAANGVFVATNAIDLDF